MFVWGSHTFATFRAHVHTNVTTITRFAKNCTMGITVLLCAYFQTTLLFAGQFFFCLVCGVRLLHTKIKEFPYE